MKILKVRQLENDIVQMNEEEATLMTNIQANENLLNELLRPFDKFKEAIKRRKNDSVLKFIYIW